MARCETSRVPCAPLQHGGSRSATSRRSAPQTVANKCAALAADDKKEKRTKKSDGDADKRDKKKTSRAPGEESSRHHHHDGEHHHHHSSSRDKDGVKSPRKEKKERSSRPDDKDKREKSERKERRETASPAPNGAANDVDHEKKLAELEQLNQKISAVRAALEAEKNDIEAAKQAFEVR